MPSYDVARGHICNSPYIAAISFARVQLHGYHTIAAIGGVQSDKISHIDIVILVILHVDKYCHLVILWTG